MGLDINVYKPVGIGDRNPQEVDYFYLISENTELQQFSNLQFERNNEYYDIEGALKQMGYDYKDLTCYSQEYGENVTFLFKTSTDEEVCLVDPPILVKKEMCLMVEEIGYQRKGANKKFYEDDMWDSPCITDRSVLLDHWEKYFSYNKPDSKGEFVYGVEYELTDNEMRSRFKENIIDKFIDGETFVIYH